MIPVINAARQESRRRSVRIADMLHLPFMPLQNKAWHPEGRLVYPVADSGTVKKLRVMWWTAIQRFVMARRPRNDFCGSISGTAVLRLVSPQGLDLQSSQTF